MLDEDDDVPPFDPIKVALFAALLGTMGFAAWRLCRVPAAPRVAAGSKNYRGLFTPRSAAPPAAPEPAPALAEPPAEPASSIGMLEVDDEMRAPKPAPEPEPAPVSAAAAPSEPPPRPVAVIKAAVVPRKAARPFNQPRLNSGAFSRLNGGAGVGFSGSAMGGGGAAPTAAVASSAAVIPGLPDLSAIPGIGR